MAGHDQVTSQVTTAPGNGRPSATYTDMGTALTCTDPTLRDGVRRNGHVW
jgi:hypothetical protein